MPATLVLLRHGESEWNSKNLFTGWVDVDLTELGEKQARDGGALLREAGLLPTVVHTSVMTRAIRTSNLALDACGRGWIPVSGTGGSTSGTTARCRGSTRAPRARSTARSSS
jgi:2,3-bisphosphoglycerate-dependent phosphoglycerate mutase